MERVLLYHDEEGLSSRFGIFSGGTPNGGAETGFDIVTGVRWAEWDSFCGSSRAPTPTGVLDTVFDIVTGVRWPEWVSFCGRLITAPTGYA